MKINFDKIICINSGSLNDQQLFAVCETYLIGFEAMHGAKKAGITMEWLTEDRETIAFVLNGRFTIAERFCPLSKREYDRIKKIKPVKTPKMPKTDAALNNYEAFLLEGYDIRTKSLDSKLDAKYKDSLLIDSEAEIDTNLPVVLELDAILEKIFKYGINSITAEEKALLDNHKL